MVYSHRGCRYSINITEDTTLHQHHSVGCSPPHRHTVHGECAVSANDNDWGFGSWTLCLRIYDFPIYLLPRVLRNSEQLFPRQKLHVQKVYSLGYGRGVSVPDWPRFDRLNPNCVGSFMNLLFSSTTFTMNLLWI